MSIPHRLRWGGIGRWLPGLVISVIGLGFLVRIIDFLEFSKALAQIQVGWLSLTLVFYFLGLAFRALAWKMLLQDKASFGRVFLTLNEGYLLNNVLPFRLGELGRAFLLGRAAGLSSFYVLSTILIERAFDLALAAGLLLTTLPLVLEMRAAEKAAGLALGAVALGLVVFFLIARYRDPLKRFLESRSRSNRFLNQSVLARLEALFLGLGVLNRPRFFLLSLGAMLLSWFFGMAEIQVLLTSGHLQAPYWWIGFVVGVVSFGLVLPSAPAALGLYEVTMVGALAVLGVPASQALAFALIAHFIHIIVTGVIGSVALFRDGQSLAGIYRRLRGQR